MRGARTAESGPARGCANARALGAAASAVDATVDQTNRPCVRLEAQWGVSGQRGSLASRGTSRYANDTRCQNVHGVVELGGARMERDRDPVGKVGGGALLRVADEHALAQPADILDPLEFGNARRERELWKRLMNR